MERLGQGETRLDRDGLNTMLQEAGVSPDRLRKVGKLAETLAEGRRRGSKYIRYRREDDVRDAPRWGGNKPVLLIAGESGAGKSWQLASLMQAMTGDGEPVVFVRGTGTAEEIRTRAAREIWQVGLGETSDKTLQGVANFLRDKAFQLRSPRFTIAVDDVGDADVVRELVRQDWTSLGGRLVMTVPPVVVGALHSTDRDDIGLHRVGDFSIEELDTLLKKFGHRWSGLPEDLKRLLRKPVLAGLFLDLGVSSFQNAPQSEYEIFQAFWDRIDEKCSVGDKGIITAVADCAVEGARYPLPREHWSDYLAGQQEPCSTRKRRVADLLRAWRGRVFPRSTAQLGGGAVALPKILERRAVRGRAFCPDDWRGGRGRPRYASAVRLRSDGHAVAAFD